MATKEKTKESFVMYDSFLQAADYLPAEAFKEFIMKLRDYALYDIDELSENPSINMMMAMAKPNLDKAEERRKKAIENGRKGAQFGNQGGAPRKGETREEYDARRLARTPNNPQTTPNEPLNVNVNDNVEVDVDGNVNEKVDGDGDGNGKVNAQGVINAETLPSPSSFPSPSSSFSSDSQKTIDKPQQVDSKDTLIPTCYSNKKKEEKTNISCGGTAATSGEGESMKEYLLDMFGKNISVLKRYRLNNLDFDETYRNAHGDAVRYASQIWGFSSEKAKEQINKTVGDWVREQKEAVQQQ